KALEAFSAVVFFFSSRRRHTRCLSDWSSDVCSSDLQGREEDRWRRVLDLAVLRVLDQPHDLDVELVAAHRHALPHRGPAEPELRSEERRVGKGCSSGWWAENGEATIRHGGSGVQ